ncbi:endo-1,4-beta-xylanase [Catenovulum sediminis]|uniref:endo-1,4-beta-xylanase n=1 Tax=Catenovulum sediminis TaxID=1740262 RepID=UPI00117F8006|nr:endo-1,4-beta-xylanase [Catenovulum sediminis]
MNKILKALVTSCTLIGLVACGSGNTNIPEAHYSNDGLQLDEPLTEYSQVTVTSLKEGADLPIGVAVPAGGASNSIFVSEERKNIVLQHFSQVSAENIMKMDALHPSQGNFNFDAADELVNFAANNGLSVHGHVLVWHSQTAGWMESFSGSKVEWIDMMENHVTQIATHFSGRLQSWDVVNEAFLENGEYRDDGSIWYQNIGAEFIERAFTTARSADANAELYYNDYNLSSSEPKIDAVVAMVKDFQARNIPIDGVGFQMHIGADSPSADTIKAHFQKVVDLGIKVKITELDIRMNAANNDDALTPDIAERQKERYYEVVSAYLETVPAAQRGGITIWGITDADSWIINLYDQPDWPLLFNSELEAKPALQGVADAIADNQ